MVAYTLYISYDIKVIKMRLKKVENLIYPPKNIYFPETTELRKNSPTLYKKHNEPVDVDVAY